MTTTLVDVRADYVIFWQNIGGTNRKSIFPWFWIAKQGYDNQNIVQTTGSYIVDAVGPDIDHLDGWYEDIQGAMDDFQAIAIPGLIGGLNTASVDNASGEDFAWSGNIVSVRDEERRSLLLKQDAVPGKGLSTNDYTNTEKTKLSGIATAATANDTDANLKNRNNHTGTQSADTVIDGTTNKAYTGTEKTKLAGIAAGATVGQKAVEGTTVRNNAFSISKNFNVSSGVATFHLTDDGLSTGNPLFTGGVIKDSLQFTYNDASGSFQQAAVWSNSDKTVTATVNKFTTANILSGLLGQTAANGTNVRMTVLGYA